MKQLGVYFIAYLIGSIPFAYLFARWKTGKDIRDLGSGNVGATNVTRSAGKLAGLMTLLLDAGKGAFAVFIGFHFVADPSAGAIAGFLAMLGHSYPVFLGFRGGKSVATGVGAFSVLSPFSILCCVVVFIVVFFLVRIVSVGSIVATALFPVFAWIFGVSPAIIFWGSMGAGLVVFRHQANIRRLMKGTERHWEKET